VREDYGYAGADRDWVGFELRVLNNSPLDRIRSVLETIEELARLARRGKLAVDPARRPRSDATWRRCAARVARGDLVAEADAAHLLAKAGLGVARRRPRDAGGKNGGGEGWQGDTQPQRDRMLCFKSKSRFAGKSGAYLRRLFKTADDVVGLIGYPGLWCMLHKAACVRECHEARDYQKLMELLDVEDPLDDFQKLMDLLKLVEGFLHKFHPDFTFDPKVLQEELQARKLYLQSFRCSGEGEDPPPFKSRFDYIPELKELVYEVSLTQWELAKDAFRREYRREYKEKKRRERRARRQEWFAQFRELWSDLLSITRRNAPLSV